ncbi:MAG: hypothetical protein ACI837_000711 [Crocinitomicaceae bacterium]|jgi:hypothetical protein
MKTIFTTLVVLGCIIQCNAQIISQFNFDSDPVTVALIGPDSTSVSVSARSDVNGIEGINELNAAFP